MRTFLIAWRNLLRNRRRSLTTLLALVIGLNAILLFGGYRSNLLYGMVTGSVHALGHIEVQRQHFFTEGGDNPSAFGIADYQEMINVIQRDPLLGSTVLLVTPTLQLGGLAGNFAAGVSRSVIATGIVPEQRDQIEQWDEFGTINYVKRLALMGTSPDTVELGEGVARRLKLCHTFKISDCVQSEATLDKNAEDAPPEIVALSGLEPVKKSNSDTAQIEMLVASAGGAPNVASLHVIDVRNMGVKSFDDVYMVMHLSQAQKLIYGSGKPEVTALQVLLKHTADLETSKARLRTILAQRFGDQDLVVLDFKALNPGFGQTMQFINSIFGFIAALIAAIVVFTVGNTMSTAVVERTVEIGTLRAMGLRRSGIRFLFLCEGLILALIGTAIGLSIALLTAALINHSGLCWTPPGYTRDFLIMIRIWEDPALLASSVVGLILIVLISAWWPASRAARATIVDALRHV